jgi:AGZA family xanthine/uracil permease-like MFS transporter
MTGRLSRFLQLDAHRSTVRRETVAGVTTFLTMAYIVVVNPAILSEAGMDRQALITATALAAIFGTLLIGLRANVAFAMAPGWD